MSKRKELKLNLNELEEKEKIEINEYNRLISDLNDESKLFLRSLDDKKTKLNKTLDIKISDSRFNFIFQDEKVVVQNGQLLVIYYEPLVTVSYGKGSSNRLLSHLTSVQLSRFSPFNNHRAYGRPGQVGSLITYNLKLNNYPILHDFLIKTAFRPYLEWLDELKGINLSFFCNLKSNGYEWQPTITNFHQGNFLDISDKIKDDAKTDLIGCYMGDYYDTTGPDDMFILLSKVRQDKGIHRLFSIYLHYIKITKGFAEHVTMDDSGIWVWTK